MRLMIIYNDTSGKNEGQKIAENLKELAQKEAVEEVILQQTNPKIDEEQVLHEAQVHAIDTIAIVGGDGTIHHVIRMFKDQLARYTFGVIPAGTVNNLARVLDISLDIQEACETIFSSNTRNIDYALVNDDVMISTLTVGILADTASKVSQKEKQKYGFWAFLKNFFRLLLKKTSYGIDIQTEEDSWKGKVHLMTINMTNSVGGFKGYDLAAAPDDGFMHFTIIPALRKLRFVYNLPHISNEKYDKISNVVRFSASRAKITSLNHQKKVVTRTDGDSTDDLPIRIQVVPKGIKMIVD